MFPFATKMNFIDPTTNDAGEPYGPSRVKEIIKEAYIISKNCATPYNEVLQLSCYERDLLLSFIREEIVENKKRVEEFEQKRK